MVALSPLRVNPGADPVAAGILCLSAGSRSVWCPSRKAAVGGCGGGDLGISAQAAAPDPDSDNQ